MIPRVHPRGRHVGGLIRYLYGPGKREEHTDPHLVAAWAGSANLATLEPPCRADGRHDIKDLVGRLEQPVRAARQPPKLTVWHCSIRNHSGDRVLTDDQWGHIAAEVMAGVGLAPHGDVRAVRWVAIRHAPDHIHLVATLVRQDGRTAWAWQDKLNSRAVCADLEERYGLVRVAPSDRTGHRYPSPAEVNKAARLNKPRTARDDLRQRVRTAAAAAVSEYEFVGLLADTGVRVAFRFSAINPGESTGYKVALADHVTAAGDPVWYSGGALAADLTLPKLRQRWAHAEGGPDAAWGSSTAGGRIRVSPTGRSGAHSFAASLIGSAADKIRNGGHEPGVTEALVQGAADVFTAAAYSVEGEQGGSVTRAADLFDRAARAPFGAIAAATARSFELRAAARMLHLMGRVSGDEDTKAALALLVQLIRLGDALTWLRDSQHRWHQADAARQASAALTAAVEAGGPAAARTTPRTASDTAPRTAESPNESAMPERRKRRNR